MAIITGIGTGDMRGALPGSSGAVMTGVAGSGHRRVIHYHRCP